MRQLHVVGLSADGRHLLLAAALDAERPSHTVSVDERFQAALRGQLAEVGEEARPTLSVRDIQARLRAGGTIEEVAAAAGVPPSRVERFAGPVLSERERVLTAVRSGVQVSRKGVADQPLARAVETALDQVGHLRPETLSWTAYRRADGVWVARLTFVARGRQRVAEWALDETTRQVRPQDSVALGLGHGPAASTPARTMTAPRPTKPAPKPTKPGPKATARPAPKATAKAAPKAAARPVGKAALPVTTAARRPR